MRKKILIVEDDPIAQIAIMDQIKTLCPYTDITLASNKIDVYSVNDLNKFDLVILDYNLDNTSGPEIMYELNLQTPIYNFLFITADVEKHKLCNDTGLTCLLKPISDEEFKKHLKEYKIIE